MFTLYYISHVIYYFKSIQSCWLQQHLRGSTETGDRQEELHILGLRDTEMLPLITVVLFMVLNGNPAEGIWEFDLMKNTFIVDLSDEIIQEAVELECNVSTAEDVYWTTPNGQNFRARTIIITVREYMDVGNFTCHLADGDIVDYKVILLNNTSQSVQNKVLSASKHAIHCEAKNYSGHFNCAWVEQKKKSVQYIIDVNRGHTTIPCNSPVKSDSRIVVSCHDPETCVHGEEDERIMFYLHVITEKSYEFHQQSFMLRDITKPDPPQDLLNSGRLLEWKYPKTWCNIHSFFPLIFNVHVTNNTKSEHIIKDIEGTKFRLPKKGRFHFCVQARDMFYNSSWSDWTCSKSATKTKDRKKNKKKKTGKNKYTLIFSAEKSHGI